jgi:exopolysaccharide biosynthesis polyprenyl glycosylphosphotransferase
MASTVEGLALAGLGILTLFFLVGALVDAQVELALALAGSGLVIFTGRRLMAGLAQKLRLRVEGQKRVLIYGCGETGQLVMKKLMQAAYLGRTVVGFVDDYATVGSKIVCRVEQFRRRVRAIPVLGRGRELAELIERHRIDELLVTTPASEFTLLQDLTDRLGENVLDVAFVPGLAGLRADQLEVQDIGAVPLLQPSRRNVSLVYRSLKRTLDLSVAMVSLVIAAPVWLVAAVAIWLESGGPILFRQSRIGLHGRSFIMYKFRTLARDADPYAPSTSVRDPRATGVGALLRATGFDEFPQLLNVLRGEMSLVGPRPEMPFLAAEYGELERLRLAVKPGITGVWQLSPDREGAAIHDNLEYDLYYIRNQGLLLDVLLLVETLFFTAELMAVAVYDTVKHRGRGRAAPTISTGGHTNRTSQGTSDYVLVALDQRLDGETPPSWRACLPQVREIARTRPLKVLVARDNVATLDRMLERRGGGSDERRPDVEYVPYENRNLVRLTVRNAAIVITDLPYVRRWACEGRVIVIGPEDFQSRRAVEAITARPTHASRRAGLS